MTDYCATHGVQLSLGSVILPIVCPLRVVRPGDGVVFVG